MANSVDPDQTPHSAASDLGLHCLLRPVYYDTKVKYGMTANKCTRPIMSKYTWKYVCSGSILFGNAACTNI